MQEMMMTDGDSKYNKLPDLELMCDSEVQNIVDVLEKYFGQDKLYYIVAKEILGVANEKK